MDFDGILKKIKENYSPRKPVDFDEAGLHFELEPLTSHEEIKVLEACKDVEDTQYIEALKRNSLACAIKKMNDIELGDKEDIEYEDKEGKKVSKSKFLYMLDFLSNWPSTLVDLLFDAFTSMSKGIEIKVMEEAKFEKFNVTEEPDITEKKEEFRRVEETGPAGLTDVERMNEQVKKEEANRTAAMADAVHKATNK